MSLYGMPQMLANQPVWSPMQGLEQGFSKGLNQNIKAQQAHAALLQNRLAEQKLKYTPGLIEAQTQRLQAQSQPGMQALPPGIAGQWAQLNRYKQQFGEQSPQYQQLHKALMAQQHYMQQRGNLAQTYAGIAGLRLTPTQQKSQLYTSLLDQGYPVSTISNFTDSERAAIVAQGIPYSAYRQAHPSPSMPFEGGEPTPTGIAPGVQQEVQPGLAPSPEGAPGMRGRTIDAIPLASPGGADQQLLPTASQMFPGMDIISQAPQQDPLGLAPPAQAPVAAQDPNAERIKQLSQLQADQAKSGLFKTTTTTDQQNRLAAATRAIPSLDIMAENAPLALEYAGIAGKSKKLGAKLRQSNSPIYLAYKKYKQAQAVGEQDTAMALGIKSTDQSFDAYKPLFNIDSWDVTPQQAKALFNNMGQLVHKESLQNALTLQQQRQQIQQGQPVQIGGQGAPQNAQSYQQWFSTQPKSVQDRLISEAK
jgi:hypothetical protein